MGAATFVLTHIGRLPCNTCFPPACLQELRGQQSIVFTSSVQSTHRLFLLLAALSCLPERVVEYSSLVRPEERTQHLEAFRSGAAKVGGVQGRGPVGCQGVHCDCMAGYGLVIWAQG